VWRRSHDRRRRLAAAPWLGDFPWGVAQTLHIACDGSIAPRIPTRLELAKEPQGIAAAGVPAVEAICRVRGEKTAAAVRTALALGQGLCPEVAEHGILANPQLLGNGPPRPSLTVEVPDLLVERQPPCPPLVGQLLGRAWTGWRWHRAGRRAVRPQHRRLAEGLMNGFEGLAMPVEHLVEGFRKVLQQVQAIGHLERGGGALPGPVRIGSKPIPGDHADAGMGL
jgi:hypothetical protein